MPPCNILYIKHQLDTHLLLCNCQTKLLADGIMFATDQSTCYGYIRVYLNLIINIDKFTTGIYEGIAVNFLRTSLIKIMSCKMVHFHLHSIKIKWFDANSLL